MFKSAIILLIFLVCNLVMAQTNQGMMPFAKQAYKDKIAALTAKQAELQKKLDTCEKWTGAGLGGENQNHPCTSLGWTGFRKVDIEQLKKDIELTAQEIRDKSSELKTKSGGVTAAVTLDDLNTKLTAQDLLMDTQTLQLWLAQNRVQLEAINKRIDNTLLGKYTKYVAEESIKAALNGESNVCNAVTKCGGMKKLKKQVEDYSKQIKSYPKWKAAEVEVVQPSEDKGMYSEGVDLTK